MSVTLIAEIASNAGGNLVRWREFIQAFAPYADYIKGQLTRVNGLRAGDPQADWFAKAELNQDKASEIVHMCKAEHIMPLFTVYRPSTVDTIVHLGLPVIKVGSGEAHQGDLAERITNDESFTRIFVSEGLRPAHKLYRNDSRTVLMGCVARYPTPWGAVAQRMATGIYEGWSDHSIGINEAMLAIMHGARYIEKHVQLRTQMRPPKPWEATVDEFAELRRWAQEDPDRFLGRWS